MPLAWSKVWSRALVTAVVLAMAALFACGEVTAQTDARVSASYISPFPANDKYRVAVFGAAIAEGVFSGLAPELADDAAIEVVNKTRQGSGLARNEQYDWTAAVDEVVATEQIDIAVVVFGIEDRLSIRLATGKLDLGTESWQQEYGRRVDKLIKALRKKAAAVYWLGMPIMRPPGANADIQMMNAIFRDKAYLNGVRFVDTWEGFVDQAGAFTAFGPDLTGKVRQLRTDDGIMFTGRGYQKLAHYLAQELRRDLALARAEREVPLAGDEDEQSEVKRSDAAEASLKSAKGEQALENGGADANGPADVAADNSTIELAADGAAEEKIEIIRPLISGTVMQHLKRSTQSRASEIGATLPATLNGGLTALSSLALIKSGAAAGSPDQVPVTESPYYRVLIKGDAPAPKPDRADDFGWPKAGDDPAG